jgi:hypothetical protein
MHGMETTFPMPTGSQRRFAAALLAALILVLPAPGRSASASPLAQAGPHSLQEFPMNIRMHVDGQLVLATLENTAAARGFAALLPMSLTLTEYARIERIADLPQKLSIEDAPAGVAADSGDLTYYAPWGNLAIFVEGGKYARGLVRLGRIESGLPALQRPGPLQVRIERVDETPPDAQSPSRGKSR